MKKKKQRWKQISLSKLTMIIIAVYCLFLTSKIWMLYEGELIEATPYYVMNRYEEYDIYITQWEYAPDQNKKEDAMEVIVEFVNHGLMDSEFEYEAVERAQDSLEIRVIDETSEYAILRIEGLRPKWSEVSLRIGAKGDENPLKIYTNKRAVKEATCFTNMTKNESQVKRLKAQITYDNNQIAERREKIEALDTENKKIEARIEKLQGEVYLSDEEVIAAEGNISKAQNQIVANVSSIEKLQEEIKEVEERTKNIEELLASVKGEKGDNE